MKVALKGKGEEISYTVVFLLEAKLTTHGMKRMMPGKICGTRIQTNKNIVASNQLLLG